MRRDWFCECGAPMQTMRAQTAPLWTNTLSQLLISSADITLPETYDQWRKSIKKQNANHSLREVLNDIGWSYHFHTGLIRRNIIPVDRWAQYGQRNVRAEPGHWEVRLLSCSSATLDVRFNRLFRWLNRGNERLLQLFDNNSRLQNVLQKLATISSNNNNLGMKLSDSMQRVLSRYRIEPCFSGNVYFHPKYSVEQQNNYLKAFAKWWNVLANKINLLDSSCALSVRTDANLHSLGRLSNVADEVVKILNTLIELAYSNWPLDRFTKLIGRWHIPPHLRESMAAPQILEKIGAYLSEITSEERCFVLVLLADVYQGDSHGHER
jgi:hypothetical protein